MKKFQLAVLIFLLLPVTLIVSCGPASDNGELTATGIPRLARYYGVPGVNGDTVYHKIPEAQFINQYGDTFSTSSLNGKISVHQFFFTSCEGICPVISGNMFDVEKSFRNNENVKLVSFSVDPERDSVAALNAYSQRFHCDSLQWTLLTGDKKALYEHIRNGYKLPSIEPGTGDAEDFIHSDQLVLIDRDGIIRGYYTGTDTAQVRILIEDINTLLEQK